MFDPDDIDAAFEELDARYLAGEAAAYAYTWSAITQAQAAWNRHEIPEQHRTVSISTIGGLERIAPGELIAYLRAGLNVMPDTKLHIEAVHRLTASRGGRHPH